MRNFDMTGNPLRKKANAPTIIIAVIALCVLIIGMGYYFTRPAYKAYNGPSYYIKDPNGPGFIVNPKFPTPPADKTHPQISGFDPQSGTTK
jgi:hypothetical protein